jgi:regulatory protein
MPGGGVKCLMKGNDWEMCDMPPYHRGFPLADERYAETRAHWLSRKYGAAKIRQDLKAHGVAESVIERVSSEGDLEKAKAILARKYRLPATTREEKAKRARFLQGRGFSFEVVLRLLRMED